MIVFMKFLPQFGEVVGKKLAKSPVSVNRNPATYH